MLNMLKKKNGAEMSLNVIIIAVICLIVLVVLIVIFAINSGKFTFGATSCEAKNGFCVGLDSYNIPKCGEVTDADKATGVIGYTPLTSAVCSGSTSTNKLGCCLKIGSK